MSKVVLDASAVLAVLQHERGAENLPAALMSHAVIGAVNLAEVQSKMVKNGYVAADCWQDALDLVESVEAFTAEQARIAGDLTAVTEPYGLSLGDRSCLALAIVLNAPVYTAEKIWKHLNIGVPIHVIR